MSEIVFAALIGVSGSVLVAIVSVITQLFVTKNIIKADKNNIIDQINFAEKSRLREKRLDKLSETISELLNISDGEITEKIDYARATNLIIRAQLFLDVHNKVEFELNQSLSSLGHKLRDFLEIKNLPMDSRISETKMMMNIHSEVISNTRKVLAQYSK